MEKSYLLLLVAILAVNVTAKPRRVDTKATQDYLLPLNLIPLHYDIQLVPILENLTTETQFELFKFYGDVKITVSVAKQTKMIRMHANQLNIQTINIADETGKPVEMDGSWDYPEGDEKQFLTFHTVNFLELGNKYDINIRYIGFLNNELYGFYRSMYLESDANSNIIEKWMAVTQFESTGARRAFPCWDEPFWKAQFTVAIAHNPLTQTVLSNMPVTTFDDTLWNGMDKPTNYNVTYFQKSVMMSTYLVAFAVSEFESNSNTDPEVPHVIFTDWARPDLIDYTEISNKFAPKAIKHMEAYTMQQYSINKLDQIAVPDFGAGAMENWGLVTYREPYMLYKEGVSPTSQRMGVSSIVSHELAHQWFGNLVSPKWWSHTWLNEGFATFFSYYIMDQEDPEWKRMDAIVGELHYAFQTDGRETTHPMFNQVDSPGSINANFDTIAYSKGASVIRMMQHFLGEEIFQNGIRMYLEDRKFGNADKEDLWRNMEAAIPEDQKLNASVAAIMNTWVEQSGYPVITVTRNYMTGAATATQKRFFTLPSTLESPEVWWVPLTMTTQTSPDFNNTAVQVWHTGEELSLGTEFEANKWLLLNVQEVGYYRVNYDTQNWQLLIAGLNAQNASDPTSNIHAINRAQLLDDAHALARAGILDYPTALDTTNYLSEEREYVPMNAGLSASSYIYDRLAYNEGDRYAYEYHMLGRLKPVYYSLGNITNDGTLPTDDTDMERIFRTLIYSWTCKLNDEQCNLEASNLYNQWMEEPELNQIEPDMKSVSYCAAIRTGNSTHYDFLNQKYAESQYMPGETSLIINSLSCSKNLTQLEIYLTHSIVNETSKVRRHDAQSILTAVYNNYLAVDLALDFFLTNYEQCKYIYGQSGAESVFRGIAYKLNTQEHLNKLNAFAATNDATLSQSEKSAIDSAVNTLEEILDWHQAHYQVVHAYYQGKLPPTQPPPPAGGVAGLIGSPLLAVATMALAVILGRP